MMRAWILASVGLLAVFPSGAAASPILDQSFVTGNRQYFVDGGIDIQIAQTFTVGITGNLSAIDVQIGKNCATVGGGLFNCSLFSSSLEMWILPTVNGVPETNVLTALAGVGISSSILSSDFSVTFMHFDLSGAPAVATGDVLAIMLRGTQAGGADEFLWGGALPPGGYVGGSAFSRNAFGASWGSNSSDMNFRTYVEPTAAVPEPATWLLLGTGLAAVAARRRFTKAK